MKRVFAHIGFSMAVTLLILNLISVTYVPLFAAALGMVLIAALLLPKYRQAIAVPLCLGTAVFACLLFLAVYHAVALPASKLAYQTAEATFYLIDLPHQTENGWQYLVKTKSIALVGAPQTLKLRLYTKAPLAADSYQLLSGKLTFYSTGADAFASHGAWSKDIFLSCTARHVGVTDVVISSPMRAVLQARQWITQTLLDAMPSKEGALSLAMLTGDKSYLPSETYYDFLFAGSAHLMAVSGLHLTVMAGFVLGVLKLFGVKGKAAFLPLAVTVVFYSALAGFPKSVIRAAIMLLLLQAGVLFNRHGDVLNSLGLAVFVLCLNPFAVTDVGMLYSVLAVLSFPTAAPMVRAVVKRLQPRCRKWRKPIAWLVGSAATTGFLVVYMLPVSYLFFSYVSVATVLSNLLVVPLGSLSIILSAVACVVPTVVPIVTGVNRLMFTLTHFFASSRLSVVVFGKYFGLIIALVLIIFAICFMLNNKRLMKTAAVIAVIAVAVSGAVSFVYDRYTAEVYVTQNGAVAVLCQGEVTVWNVNSAYDRSAISAFLAPRGEKIPQENAEKTAQVYGVSVAAAEVSPQAKITIDEKYITDDFGAIALRGGDVVYTIEKNGSYQARRADIWQ